MSTTQPVQDPMLVTTTTSDTEPVGEPILVAPTTADGGPGLTMSTNPMIDNQLMEDLNAVQTLVESFRETGDIDYLDRGIAVLREIIVSSPPCEDLQNFLADLLEMKAQAGQASEQAKTEGIEDCSDTEMPNTVPDRDEIADTWELVHTLRNSFERTGEIDYIDVPLG